MADTIRNREVLQVILLKTLSKFPDGVSLHKAYEDIEENFEFPSEWTRELPASSGYDELKRLGYNNWRDISQDRLVQLVSTEPQWQNEIRWARNGLRVKGLLDPSAPRGVWRLTERGMRAAAEKPEEGLTAEERRIATPRKRKPIRLSTQDVNGRKTRREELTDRLQTLTTSMPLPDLELLIDIARVVRLRSLEK